MPRPIRIRRVCHHRAHLRQRRQNFQAVAVVQRRVADLQNVAHQSPGIGGWCSWLRRNGSGSRPYRRPFRTMACGSPKCARRSSTNAANSGYWARILDFRSSGIAALRVGVAFIPAHAVAQAGWELEIAAGHAVVLERRQPNATDMLETDLLNVNVYVLPLLHLVTVNGQHVIGLVVPMRRPADVVWRRHRPRAILVARNLRRLDDEPDMCIRRPRKLRDLG